MKFKPGKIIKKFKAKNGKEVILRYPKWEDLDDLLEYINHVVKNKAKISKQTLVTREEEIKYLAEVFQKIESGDAVYLFPEVDGKVIGNSCIERKKEDALKHVGGLGIGIRKEFTNLGIGTKLVKTLLELAKKELKLKMVTLKVFSNNEIAINVYKKCGFKEVGKIPKHINYYGKYVDSIIMVKEL